MRVVKNLEILLELYTNCSINNMPIVSKHVKGLIVFELKNLWSFENWKNSNLCSEILSSKTK